MRKYLTDSPKAQARIVGVALLADGSLDKSELDLLDSKAVVQRLGISHDEFDQVIHEFCNDMMQFAVRGHHGQVALDKETIDGLLEEVKSPSLQKMLLRTVLEIVYADRQLSVGEAVLVSQALDKWSLNLSDLACPDRRASRRWPPHVQRASVELAR